MGGCPKFTLGGSVPPPRPPSGKILTYAQVLANICIIVNFQHCSSINAGLMQRSLCNRFALKGPPKWFLGAGAKIFDGNPQECNDRRSTSFGEKIWRCSKYPSLYAQQRNYKKNIKKECLRREVTFHPCAVLTSPKPIVTPLCMWGPMGDVITHAQF